MSLFRNTIQPITLPRSRGTVCLVESVDGIFRVMWKAREDSELEEMALLVNSLLCRKKGREFRSPAPA